MILAGLLIFKQTDFKEISIAENLNYSAKNESPVSAEEIISQRKPAVENVKTVVSNAQTKNNEKRLIVKKELKRQIKPQKERSSPRKNSKPIDDGNAFYPLISAGNFIDGDSRRIVRVELTRDSFAALGVNLPIDDENEKVKTDLLVGSDGVPQAFRLVKNF